MDEKYGVGLWCQNRPEWQLIGDTPSEREDLNLVRLTRSRSGLYVPVTVHCVVV